MPLLYSAAKDQIYGIALAAITANATELFETMPLIQWPGMPKLTSPAVHDFYVRVFYTEISSPQRSLSSIDNVRRYENTGQLVIQIYSPILINGSNEQGELMAQAIQAAYRNPSVDVDVTFLQQLIKAAGNDATHYQTNLFVTTQYDTIQ